MSEIKVVDRDYFLEKRILNTPGAAGIMAGVLSLRGAQALFELLTPEEKEQVRLFLDTESRTERNTGRKAPAAFVAVRAGLKENKQD